MSEPTNKELLERVKKVDAVVSTIAAELVEQREDIEEIMRVISLMNERFKSIEAFMRREHEDCFGVVRNHNERIFGLEQKVFPNMWPTIHRVEAVVGDLDERHESNPLDRRDEKPGTR